MIVTKTADSDIDDAFDFIAQDNVEAARRFTGEIVTHLHRLAALGHAGVPRDSIRPGLRLSIFGRYNIYFRVTEEQTIILRVVHSARDVGRLSFDESHR